MRLSAVVLLVCVILGGCGGRQGIVLHQDGSVSANTPENARAHAETVIADALGRQLAPRTATVAISPAPRWQNEDRARAEGWYWDMVRVDVTIAGALAGGERERIQALVRDRLDGAITGGRDALLVQVADGAAPVATVAPESVPATSVAPAPAPAAATVSGGDRRYVIQAGDTLGDLSAVFFGSAQHWRRIVEANPGLDPAHLQVGHTIVIPAKPQP